MRNRPKIPSRTPQEVAELSRLLSSLPWHSQNTRNETFRNADGVYMKLINFRSAERGSGLSWSKQDKALIDAYTDRPDDATQRAALIRQAASLLAIAKTDKDTVSIEVPFEFQEGRSTTLVHLHRERNRSLRKRILFSRRVAGELFCEICKWRSPLQDEEFFDAAFECHHLHPLGLTDGIRITRMQDVALLCANCHLLVHRYISSRGKWLSVREAQSLISW